MGPATAVGPKSRTLGTMDPDLPLVDASRNGDVSALEELVKRYDRKLYRIVQGITHSKEDAEDVVQVAFLKAYQNLHRFERKAKFSTWLIRIAMNESFMRLRKLRANREQSLNSDTRFDSLGSKDRLLERPHELSDWAMNPESLYGQTELRRILEQSLRTLQPTLRVVFILRDIEGHSIRETSAILKLTSTAVKSRLSRARMQLREELSRYFNNRI